ncbi:MAG TPA: D-glycero-beta-D-manno-heptose 1,7-bisphosphate 7-phosphatase [Geobacterales bacterium]|nr:D-glycero-beta-D-manno-heptose 1,7-bisphosphate 7-phosphatase [Geobacterales bacterium]
MSSARERAVFLDRDGTINEEVEYLHRLEDFRLIPGAVAAIAQLKRAGFRVIVVTNQSGVARGYFDLAAVERIHRQLDAELAAQGTAVDAYFVCPHHPIHGKGEFLMECACRKPLPGMLLQAAEQFGLDLQQSWMVGDKVADLQAGERAGCRSLLVATGYGRRESEQLKDRSVLVSDLQQAAQRIMEQDR